MESRLQAAGPSHPQERLKLGFPSKIKITPCVQPLMDYITHTRATRPTLTSPKLQALN